MSGTGAGDELDVLVASFVEELKPFFAGIRRGVNGIFAMPRDAMGISAARGNLGTMAASVTVLDLPAARQLGELAQLLDEAFQAAERGGVPDESRAPMLLMVDHLEAQLDGLLTGDERGRERLDNAYRLLDQILLTVEEAEAAPPSILEIPLDDLLLTLQPVAAAAPVVPEVAPVEEVVAPEPEQTQTELVLLAEEEVAPIEWGEKEAILWKKRGWDDKQTAYGNTGWIFLDEDESHAAEAAHAAAEQPAAAREGVDEVVAPEVVAPVAAETPLLVEAVDDEVVTDFDELATQGLEVPTDFLVTAPLPTDLGEVVTDALSGSPALAEVAAEASDDTLVAVEATGEVAADEPVVAAAGVDMVVEAAPTLDVAAATDVVVEAAPTLDVAAATEMVVDDAATPDVAAATDVVLDTAAVAIDADGLEEAALLALNPAELEIYLALESPDQHAFLAARVREMTDFATDLGLAVDTVAADAAAGEKAAKPARKRTKREKKATEPLSSAPEVPADAEPATTAAVDSLVLTEYRPTEPGTGQLAMEGPGTDRIQRVLDEAERLRQDRRGTDQLGRTAAEARWTKSLATEDLVEPEASDDDGGNFLDALLDELPPAVAKQDLVAASDGLFGDEDADFDPNYAALPDVTPELEAAFAQLSEADMMTFLTLDGESAMAFLQSRTAGAAAEPEVVAPAPAPVSEVSPASAVAMPVAPVHVAPTPVAPVMAAPAVEERTVEHVPLNLDAEIFEVFLQEVQELLAEWVTVAARLRRTPADNATMGNLRRIAHTLKGAANMVGFLPLGAVGWRVEDLLDLLDEHSLAVAPAVFDFIDRSYALAQRLSADTAADPRTFANDSVALDQVHARLVAAVRAGELGLTTEGEDSLIEAVELELGAVDGELLEVFIQEAEDHLGAFNRAIVALDKRPSDSEQLAEAKRVVHTLKGSAAALGYPVTAALCHSLEDLFESLDESRRAPSREMLTLFFDSAETLEGLVSGIAAGRGEDQSRADQLRLRYASFMRPEQGRVQPVAAAQEDRVVASSPTPEAADAGRAVEAPRSVRVDIAHLDNLLNLVGELVINRTSQEQHLERLGRTVAELLLSVDRLRRVGFQLESRYEVAELLRSEGRAVADEGLTRPRALTLVGGTAAARGEEEFDSLEMDRYTELHSISRELVEIAADINAAGTELDVLHDNFDQTLSRQGRIATDLQDRMMEVRLIPLSTIAARLYRAVRGVANRRSRPTELVLTGETVEIDKVLLEEITDPLLHLVRNAVDHGIESPDERAARGKPAVGTVHLSAAREGNEAVIRVSDDGGGIDLDRVLDKALARGVVRRREGLTPEQIMDLIFLPGFSTSATISDISGRGVGLDVVRTNVARLKGTIDVDSTVGVGTTFTIRLPIMLAVTRALLVRSGAQTFAIPLPVVDQVAFFRKELMTTIGGAELFDLGGQTYPVLMLSRALGLPTSGDPAPTARALIVGNADRRVALVVDELVGQQEVVVKRLGRHLQSVAGVAGATILGSGQVVLILNVLDLIGSRRTARAASAAPQPIRTSATVRPVDSGRVAMVVDDSLSVRRVLTRTLERDGWQVLGAKDGVEALEMLAWAKPQVMVLDIEMPRMDGYELTSLIRSHPDHHALPIAMLTSRAGEKHRRKALDLGVSAYLVKPFEEAELLRTVRELSASARSQVAN